jgi:hypothetical protein
MLRWLNIALLSVGSPAFAAESLSANATHFIRDGAKAVLRACEIPKRTCNGWSFRVESVLPAESNDEKRSVEVLSLSGMRMEVIFPSSSPKHYYVAQMEVDRPNWSSSFGLAPRSTRREVQNILGRPNRMSASSCDEYFDEETQSFADVCYSGEQVSRIRWEYFID